MGYHIENDRVPPGFRRGMLAGLDQQERSEKLLERHRLGYRAGQRDRPLRHSLGNVRQWRQDSPHTKEEPMASLERLVGGYTVDSIRDLLRKAGYDKRFPTRKAELVDIAVNEALPLPRERFVEALATADEATLQLVRRIAAGERVPARDGLYELFPFVFVSKVAGTSVAFMPPELQRAYAQVDLEPLVLRRREEDIVMGLVTTYVTLCGVASMDDMASHYLALGEHPLLDREAFVDMVATLARKDGSCFSVFEAGDKRYVCHEQLDKHRIQSDGSFRYEYDRRDSTPPDAFRPNEMRIALVQHHEGLPSRALEAHVIGFDAVEYVYGLPCVRNLVTYFDEHVPEGENEYVFADKMVDILLEAVMIRCATLSTVIWWLTRMGWYLAEGTNTSPRLTRLVFDLFRQLPRWEFNGWSETEVLERFGTHHLISETSLDEVPRQNVEEVIPPTKIMSRWANPTTASGDEVPLSAYANEADDYGWRDFDRYDW